MSTIPTKISEPGSGAAAVGKSMAVKGQIYSREDLFVDGEVEGTIEVQEHRLTVGPNGKVKASIRARELVVRGTIHGDVEASDKIDIRKDAKVVGDLRTGRIIVEDGAYFKGSIDMARQEVARVATASLKPDSTKPAVAAS
jgi:cytoskeletal protein CcmA (bactofilin family)